jgi:hypothetical protein
MATILDNGKPNTIVLDRSEVEEILATAATPEGAEQAIRDLKAAHGLPAHAPHAVHMPELPAWLDGYGVQFVARGRRARPGEHFFQAARINGPEVSASIQRHGCVG